MQRIIQGIANEPAIFFGTSLIRPFAQQPVVREKPRKFQRDEIHPVEFLARRAPLKLAL